MTVIPMDELDSLLALISRLEGTEPLSELELFYRSRRRNIRRLRPEEDPDDFKREIDAEILARPPSKYEHKSRDKNHPVYGDTNYALGFHVQQLSDFLDDWFYKGASHPPNSHSDRIKIILKRAKLKDVRARFEASFDKHFGNFWKPTIHREPSGDAMLDMLQNRIPRLEIYIDEIEDQGDGLLNYRFNFHCCDCGGWIVTVPDEDDPEGPAMCEACKQVFGTRQDMNNLAMHIGNEKAKKIGLM